MFGCVQLRTYFCVQLLALNCCCTRFEFLLYDSAFDLPAVFDAFCLVLRWLGWSAAAEVDLSQLICVLVCCESQRTHRVGSCFAFHMCTNCTAAAAAAAAAANFAVADDSANDNSDVVDGSSDDE